MPWFGSRNRNWKSLWLISVQTCEQVIFSSGGAENLTIFLSLNVPVNQEVELLSHFNHELMEDLVCVGICISFNCWDLWLEDVRLLLLLWVRLGDDGVLGNLFICLIQEGRLLWNFGRGLVQGLVFILRLRSNRNLLSTESNVTNRGVRRFWLRCRCCYSCCDVSWRIRHGGLVITILGRAAGEGVRALMNALICTVI